MKRQAFDFASFKKNFIEQPDGYFPVYSSLDEDENGKSLRVLQMDMICEWRMTDSKVRFIEVFFDTEEEFNQLVEYLKETARLLNKAILIRISQLNYSDTE